MAVWLRACLQAGISMHTSSAAFWLSKSWCSVVLQNSRLTPLQCGKWKLTALSLPLKYSCEENVSSQASLSSSSSLLVLVLKDSMERQVLTFANWMENQCCYCLKKSIMEYSWCSVTWIVFPNHLCSLWPNRKTAKFFIMTLSKKRHSPSIVEVRSLNENCQYWMLFGQILHTNENMRKTRHEKCKHGYLKEMENK